MEDSRAGELYADLFTALVDEFNLEYGYNPYLHAPGIQATFAYSVYRLGVVARRWSAFEKLYRQILLPAIQDEVEAELSKYTARNASSEALSRVIDPLVDWGLVEERLSKPDRYRITRPEAVRITSLYKRFFTFSGNLPPQKT